MNGSLSSVFSIYRHPTGRREVVHEQTGRIAAELGLTELRDHCTMAIAHERSLRTMVREYRTMKNQPMNPRLTKLDPMIDRLVGAINRGANDVVTAMAGSPEAALAEELLARALPRGAAGVTTLNYYEESAEVHGLLGLLEGALADHVRVLGLTLFVTQLRTLNDEFREILSREPKTSLTYDQLRAADEVGQEHLLQTIAMIVGRFPTMSTEHVGARTRLLAPIVRQNELIRDYLRARRAVADVDPTTGEELPETGTTAAGTAGAGVVPGAPAAGSTAPIA